MSEPTLTPDQVARAAARFAVEPIMAAYWLRLDREATGTNEEAQAAELGCSLETLHHLCLCGRVREHYWHEDVQEISEHLTIDAARLNTVMRRAMGHVDPFCD